jgi:NTE family protein
LAERAELIVLPPPCPLSISPIDFSQAEELIARGYADGRRYLDALEAGRAAAPLTMAMHSHASPRELQLSR